MIFKFSNGSFWSKIELKSANFSTINVNKVITLLITNWYHKQEEEEAIMFKRR